MRSLRNTTLPGVAARFSPTRKADESTWRGRPPLVSTSRRKLASPAITDRPPVSKARRRAAGLVHRKLVGARASTRMPRAKRAFSVVAESKPAASTSS